MKYLADKLEKIGVERRFALDIGSVVLRVRPRGLLHVPAQLTADLGLLLKAHGLHIEASRELYRRQDSTSREGVLGEYLSEYKFAEKWCEIWYASPGVPVVDRADLFSNPGKFLGYPRCCRRAMVGNDALAHVYQRYLFEDKNRHWELNRLATLFHDIILMPDFFPCSMACASAHSYVVTFHQVACQIFSQSEIEDARNAMLAPITIIGEEVVQWRQWQYVGHRLCVKLDGAKKETLSRISSILPIQDKKSAQLISFKEVFKAGHDLLPQMLRVEANGQEIVEIPLKIL